MEQHNEPTGENKDYLLFFDWLKGLGEGIKEGLEDRSMTDPKLSEIAERLLSLEKKLRELADEDNE